MANKEVVMCILLYIGLDVFVRVVYDQPANICSIMIKAFAPFQLDTQC